ncbi:ABC-type branched-chain amino acid transport system, periplasmic component [Deinococcus gobiensis I-0]|uniref:ABC-type branched-chain amino acid transport system, periplasmic component n=1 Tax=Deinococcus gobiensis (strain DSM 21396 / JCM 16679 / CGMCC 1.7299 / I-0) TaxID=745776 RepID=H8GU56_DEIGI|nr:ABC-type branched-chain amino acid transport system, periplasmic component [Deinococcus gobiensis I-0]
MIGAALGAASAQKVETPVAIGIAVAQTSNVALFGQEQVAGAKLAEKLINARGGIGGTPIRLVYQDAAGDENSAINAFQNLITKERVVGIVGPTLSQQAFAADPIAERARIPVLGPSNTAKGIPQIGNYIARVSAPVTVIAPAALKQALKIDPKIKRVAVMYAQNDAFSVSETGIFQDTIKAQGLTVATVQKSQTTDTDFTTQVTAVLNAKADLVVISALAADGGNIIKQLRQLSYKGLIVGGNGFNTTNLFPVCQKDCDGLLVAQAYSPLQSSATNQVFVKEYRALYKKDPPQFAAQAYAGVQVFADALRVIDRKKKLAQWDLGDLRTELNKQILAGKYNTPLGELRFDKEGEINQKEFFVAQVKMKDAKNGSFVFVK